MIDALPETHRCAAPGCQWTIPKTILMCREHWAMVSPEAQSQVWRAYTDRNRGAYIIARREAIASVGELIEAQRLAQAAKPKQGELSL